MGPVSQWIKFTASEMRVDRRIRDHISALAQNRDLHENLLDWILHTRACILGDFDHLVRQATIDRQLLCVAQ